MHNHLLDSPILLNFHYFKPVEDMKKDRPYEPRVARYSSVCPHRAVYGGTQLLQAVSYDNRYSKQLGGQEKNI